MRPQLPTHRILPLLRVLIVAAIAGLVAHHARSQPQSLADVPLAVVRDVFPEAAAVRDGDPLTIADADGRAIAAAVRTQPAASDIVGFAGPSDLLIVFDADAIAAVRILASRDTAEHVDQIRDAGWLDRTYAGLTWEQARGISPEVDAVSGATLTASAMARSISRRLGGEAPQRSLFDDVLPIDDRLTRLLPGAAAIEPLDRRGRFAVLDAAGESVGSLLRSSPAADGIIGYQGPTESFAVFDAIGPEGQGLGLIVGESFDNEPYVGYLRDDKYGFLRSVDGLTLADIAARDSADPGLDAVSGATMTSLAVHDGLTLAAATALAPPPDTATPNRNPVPFDWGLLAVIAVAVVIATTHLRGRRRLRVAWLLFLIAYLGLLRGDMLSQAMLVGWLRSGVPWQAASGLAMLTAAALLLPIGTKRNVYCTHLCPHGAVQQLAAGRVARRRLPRWLRFALRPLVPALLVVVLLHAFDVVSVSLVGLEPFDAWHGRLAGAATIAVLVASLLASLWEPMAYCRHGCPTGAILQHLRRRGRADRWTIRDTVAASLLVLSIVLSL